MMHRLNFGRTCSLRQRRNERGQTAIFVVLALSLFMLGFTGLAADYTNLWFHRQAAQAAADAACEAGAMDMYYLEYLKTPTSASSNFVPGFTPTLNSSFDCSDSTNAASTPCKYASLNGYNGDGVSNNVVVSFPETVTGATGATNIPVPFIGVKVTDHVRVYLSPLITGKKNQDVAAAAYCGLVPDNAPIPLIVLHPTLLDSLSVQGSPTIDILGGPPQSVQVNSRNRTEAVNVGGNATIDLQLGGPDYNGSSLGTDGPPASKPPGFLTAGSGRWLYPSSPIQDPLQDLIVPSVPSTTWSGPYRSGVAYHDPEGGCPDTAGCDYYKPGYYPNGIKVPNTPSGATTAIFDPGFYYVKGGLKLWSNSEIRPSKKTFDSTSAGYPWGTMFYLTGSTVTCSGQTGLVCTGSNSGKSTTVDDLALSQVPCPGQDFDQKLKDTGKLPATGYLSGNILLAPCAGLDSSAGVDYGGSSDDRGVLFFGDRDNNGGAGWGGGGSYLLAGTIYIHQCNSAAGTGLGTKCNESTGFGANFQLLGGSGSTSYVLGEIIADSLALGGNSEIAMVLNANKTKPVVRVALVK